MPLIDSQDTVIDLIREDHELAHSLLSEAIEVLLTGEPDVCRILLRDLVNATLGFEKLSIATEIPPKSLHRMLSAKGNPSMGNLSRIIKELQCYLGIEIKIEGTISTLEHV